MAGFFNRLFLYAFTKTNMVQQAVVKSKLLTAYRRKLIDFSGK